MRHEAVQPKVGEVVGLVGLPTWEQKEADVRCETDGRRSEVRAGGQREEGGAGDEATHSSAAGSSSAGFSSSSSSSLSWKSSSSVGVWSPVTTAFRCEGREGWPGHGERRGEGVQKARCLGAWTCPRQAHARTSQNAARPGRPGKREEKREKSQSHLLVKGLVEACVLLLQQGHFVLKLHLQLDVLALQLFQREHAPLGLGRELEAAARANHALQLALRVQRVQDGHWESAVPGRRSRARNGGGGDERVRVVRVRVERVVCASNASCARLTARAAMRLGSFMRLAVTADMSKPGGRPCSSGPAPLVLWRGEVGG